MRTVNLNLTALEISILEDPVSDPDQLDIKGLNFGYVILLLGGLMLFLVSVVMLYIRRKSSYGDDDDEQDVYLIAREMHHRELALQKKQNVNNMSSFKDRPLLDQIPEQEI